MLNVPSFDEIMESIGIEVGIATSTEFSVVAGYRATQTEQAKEQFAKFEAARQTRLAKQLADRLNHL